MNKYKNMTDEELAIDYMNGDAIAFDEILERYKARIFSYIYYTVPDRDEANELFQETFVKVIGFLKEQRYKPKGLFNFWIIRIAHNAISDKFRRNERKFIREPNVDNDLTRINSDDITVMGYDNDIMRDQTFDKLHQMVDRLPSEQREMVYLRYFEEMSFKDIAAITGVSINTALGRMRYAILNLRKMADVRVL